MKIAIATVAGLAAAASAQTTTIDLSGIGVDGAAPTVLTTTLGAGALDSIEFDVTVTTASPSWGSEINIAFTHVDSGFSFVADGADFDFDDDGPADLIFGWGNFIGTFSYAGSVDLTGMLADASGDWNISLSDDFDDIFVNPDHVYGAESSVSIVQVPAPAGLAILGLGGVVAARRRR